MFTREQLHQMVRDNQQEALDCLVEIVQTPSTTGHEKEVAKVFYKWIEKAGLKPEYVGESEDYPNIIAQWNGTQPGKKFQFNGHMDTFPPTEGDNGTYGPYSGKIADGYIWGRGTCDMKGGDAAALMAVTFLKRMGFDPKGSIELSYMVDEEFGSWHGVKWLLDHGYLKGDVGICMEPTNDHLKVGHSGIWRTTVTFRGDAAASARPHPSMDALKKAWLAMGELYKLQERLKERTSPYYGHSHLGITRLFAGTHPNTYATQAVITIDRRMLPGESNESCEREYREALDVLQAQYPDVDMSYELNLLSDRPVLDVPEDDPFIVTLKECVEEVVGHEVKFLHTHGGGDGGNIFDRYGTPMPQLSPGDDIDMPCTADERVSVEGYLNAIEYYMLAVVRTLS